MTALVITYGSRKWLVEIVENHIGLVNDYPQIKPFKYVDILFAG